MTKTRRKHLRQLGTLYTVLFITGYLWRRPHTPLAWVVLLVIFFGLAPWLVLRQPDQPDA